MFSHIVVGLPPLSVAPIVPERETLVGGTKSWVRYSMMDSVMDTDLAYCGVADADAVVDSVKDADLGVMVVGVETDAVVDSVRLFQYVVDVGLPYCGVRDAETL